jgi:hypothetical protein
MLCDKADRCHVPRRFEVKGLPISNCDDQRVSLIQFTLTILHAICYNLLNTSSTSAEDLTK